MHLMLICIRLISCLYLRQREVPVKGRGPESVRRVSRDAKVAPTPDYNGRISQVYEWPDTSNH